MLVAQIAAGHGTSRNNASTIIDSFSDAPMPTPTRSTRRSASLRAVFLGAAPIDGVFFDLASMSSLLRIKQVLPLRYSGLLVIFLLATVYLLLYRRRFSNTEPSICLIAAMDSPTRPLSWYTIFKAHSYIHTT